MIVFRLPAFIAALVRGNVFGGRRPVLLQELDQVSRAARFLEMAHVTVNIDGQTDPVREKILR